MSAAGRGCKAIAFFDLDGTLIDGYSVRAFLIDGLRHHRGGPGHLARGMVAAVQSLATDGWAGTGVEPVMKVAAAALRGEREDDLERWGERVFRDRTARLEHAEARRLVAHHQRLGHMVVVASSATPWQVGPVARDLGVEHVLCTRFAVGPDGRLTGDLAGPFLWAEEKAVAARSFAAAHAVDLDDCWAYADGEEEVPLLSAVGHPCAVNPGRRLASVAAERGWDVRRFKRPERPGPVAAARTGAAVAGLAALTSVGIGVGLLNRSRRQASNLVISAGTDLSLALAGVRLEVTGEEHLWSHRPAVFIFNHQSTLDAVIMGNLLRRDITGVAKREAARDPRFAAIGALLGLAWVDRADHAQAVGAVNGVREALAGGTSVVIAPEGTRSPTTTVGRFKKGAFHLAREAGAPVVPVVIRNSGQLMWRGSTLVQPGVIDVAVLPPIDVGAWPADELAERVEDVRQMFVDRLAGWST